MGLKSNHTPQIFLTFDVEEWTLPQDYNLINDYCDNTEFSSVGCLKIIDLLKKSGIKATFFVTGYFAQAHPETVRAISKAGHEVASHAYRNTNLTVLDSEEVYEGIERTDRLLRELSDREILGFRAPRCYINKQVLRFLFKLGYQYDSSIHPAIVPNHYYNFNYPISPYFIKRSELEKGTSGIILEIPMSVIPIIRFPISWWWMRNISESLTYFGTDINLHRGRDVVLYFHAWEFENLPRFKEVPLHLTKKCGDEFLKIISRFINSYSQKTAFGMLKDMPGEYSLRNSDEDERICR